MGREAEEDATNHARHFEILALGTLAFLGTVLVAGCASSGTGGGGNPTRLEVQAKDFGFDPSVLTLKAGRQYTLMFKNAGSTLHDWTIAGIPSQVVAGNAAAGHDMGSTAMPAAAELHVAADASKASELTFTPTQAGEYEYVCTVPGHRELGMRGRLVVQR